MRHELVSNPPWVTKVLAEAYDEIQEKILLHPSWVPKLTDIHPTGGSSVRGQMIEYGCGAYGCVLPTLDPTVVIKVTTDDTEAEFAGSLANTLVRPICVKYMAILDSDAKHNGRNVTILWRESANYVGDLEAYLHDLQRDRDIDFAYDLIDRQHAAAQIAYTLIYHGRPRTEQRAAVSAWLHACEQLARQTRVPELRALGDGMVEVYAAQGVVFGDIHAGNIGQVVRADGPQWVITDPGHIAVILE